MLIGPTARVGTIRIFTRRKIKHTKKKICNNDNNNNNLFLPSMYDKDALKGA